MAISTHYYMNGNDIINAISSVKGVQSVNLTPLANDLVRYNVSSSDDTFRYLTYGIGVSIVFNKQLLTAPTITITLTKSYTFKNASGVSYSLFQMTFTGTHRTELDNLYGENTTVWTFSNTQRVLPSSTNDPLTSSSSNILALNDLISNRNNRTVSYDFNFTEKDIDIDMSNADNISLDSDSYATIDENGNVTYKIIIKANDGYTIQDTPNISINHTSSFYANPYTENFEYDSNHNYWICENNINLESVTEFKVYATAVQTTPITSDYALLNVYKINQGDSYNLASVRFYKPADAQSDGEYIDLAEYILSYVRYPFNINVNETQKIKLGFYTTNINGSLPNNDMYVLSLGKFIINGRYHNQSDITNTRITAIIPFIPPFDIDSRYINTEIEIKYVVNIVSNTCSIMIYSNDNLIATHDLKIGFDIPYILTTDKITAYANISSSSINYKDVTPQIKVEKQLHENRLFSSKKRAKINTFKGTCSFTDIELNSYATKNETDKIIELLKDTVILPTE